MPFTIKILTILSILSLLPNIAIGGSPRYRLIKHSSQLKEPKLPQQLHYRTLLQNLFLQKGNCPGIFGFSKEDMDLVFGENAPTRLDRYFNDKTDILVLENKGTLMGALFFALNNENQKLDIILFAIDENHHGKGYGKQMITTLTQEYPGYTSRLAVFSDNHSAQAFYKKLKFCNIENTESFCYFQKNIK